MTVIQQLPIKFRKPPKRILGFVFCRHSWKGFWKPLDEGVSVEIQKCTRCLKEKDA